MQSDVECDVVIVGGGIIGLWLIATLKRAGYQALLVEKNALGSGQTLASQGIIHGGSKYALTGKLTGSSESVRAMPGRWRSHLRGERHPDLGRVKVNTSHQWMWAADGLGSKLAGFFSSKVMSSRVGRVESNALPDILADQSVYRLEEMVLDIKSLLHELAGIAGGCLYQAEVTDLAEADGRVNVTLRAAGKSLVVGCRFVILSAGEGNQRLQAAEMQCRPLHMIMVKGDLPKIWGHVIEAGANPRVTITSHEHRHGDSVWYIGGSLAESGTRLTDEEQILRVKQEMALLLPAIDWQSMQWSGYRINRAEGKQPGGRRPDEPVVVQQGNRITVWPTKLVFAPLVADEIRQRLEDAGLRTAGDQGVSVDLPRVKIGEYPWDLAEWV